MKKMKTGKSRTLSKVLAVLLTVSVVGAAFTGCGKNTENTSAGVTTSTTSDVTKAPDASEQAAKDPVTLVWWFPGNGEQKDTQKVNDYFNEQLKSYEGLEHVTVIFHPITLADYITQVTLGLSSGEQMDILGSCYITPLQQFIDDGTVVSIEQYMDSIPELTSTLPDWLMAYGRYNHEQYMIPNYQQVSNIGYGIIPTEYITKGYTTKEKFAKMQAMSTPLTERAQLQEELVNAVREGESTTTKYASLIANIYNGNYASGWFDQLATNFLVREGTTEVTYRPFEEETRLSYQIAADWYEKGLVPQDTTTNYDDLYKANMMNESAAVVSINHGVEDVETIEKSLSAQYGFDVNVSYMLDHNYASYTWAAGGNAVTATCEHPEEAVKLLECMSIERGKEIYNTIVYGLEGTHWEFVDKDQGIIKTLDYDGTQTESSSPYGQHKWLLGNTFNAYINQGSTKEMIEAQLKANEGPVKSSLIGITLDLSSVQAEIEQLSAVWGEYKDALIYGSKGNDWESYYNEFKTKAEKAGVADVIAELQKQVDAYLASK